MDQSKIEKPEQPYEALEEHKAHLKKTTNRAVFRGLLFLAGAIVLTYYAKFYKAPPRVAKTHGMAGWVFAQDSTLHVLLVGPDDNKAGNTENEGERFFFNPIAKAFLDNNYIRYPQRDLYMLGSSDSKVILEYCTYIDTGFVLHLQGDLNTAESCKNLDIINSSSERLSSDWALQSSLNINDSGTTFIISHAGNRTIVTDNPYLPFGDDTTQLYISTKAPHPLAKIPNSRVFISPQKSFNMGKLDSSLISEPGHAIGLVWEKDARLLLRKLWLKVPAK